MAFTFKFNLFSKTFDIVQDTTLFTLKGVVNTTADLTLSGNSENDLYIVKADDRLYTWNKVTDSGILSDWINVGSISSIDWSIINNKPTSGVGNIDDAVTKKHTQNTETILTTDGTIAVLNAGVLKINLLTDDAVNIQIDEIRARDIDGLKLYDDDGNGIFVKDGGNVGINNNSPSEKLDVIGNIRVSGNLTDGTDSVNPVELRTHLDDITTNPHDVSSTLISTDTSNFDGVLSSTEDTVQKSLDILDDAVSNLKTKTLNFIPSDANTDFGDYKVLPLSSNANGNMTFAIPEDFVSLVSLEVIYIPQDTIVVQNINLNSYYGSIGELSNVHSESSLALVINATANIITTQDISGIFTSLSAGDFAGINWKNNGIGTTVNIIMIKIKYISN